MGGGGNECDGGGGGGGVLLLSVFPDMRLSWGGGGVTYTGERVSPLVSSSSSVSASHSSSPELLSVVSFRSSYSTQLFAASFDLSCSPLVILNKRSPVFHFPSLDSASLCCLVLLGLPMGAVFGLCLVTVAFCTTVGFSYPAAGGSSCDIWIYPYV